MLMITNEPNRGQYLSISLLLVSVHVVFMSPAHSLLIVEQKSFFMVSHFTQAEAKRKYNKSLDHDDSLRLTVAQDFERKNNKNREREKTQNSTSFALINDNLLC